MIKSLSLFFLSFAFFSLQALELESKEFLFCSKKTARFIQARTLRIHHFSKENKCAVIYSIKGQDRILSHGRWLAFCKKRLKQVADNLQKGLWECEKQREPVSVFYSVN